MALAVQKVAILPRVAEDTHEIIFPFQSFWAVMVKTAVGWKELTSYHFRRTALGRVKSIDINIDEDDLDLNF